MSPDDAGKDPEDDPIDLDDYPVNSDASPENSGASPVNSYETQAQSDDDGKDLFGKLDQLISRHQGRAQPPAPAPVPTLTEAVEQQPRPQQPDIPVLHEAVEHPATEASPEWQAGERRRQIQVALYLRLRQRLDREFEALARSRGPAAAADHAALAQALQALRNALPAIVRESVDQALSNGSKPD